MSPIRVAMSGHLPLFLAHLAYVCQPNQSIGPDRGTIRGLVDGSRKRTSCAALSLWHGFPEISISCFLSPPRDLISLFLLFAIGPPSTTPLVFFLLFLHPLSHRSQRDLYGVSALTPTLRCFPERTIMSAHARDNRNRACAVVLRTISPLSSSAITLSGRLALPLQPAPRPPEFQPELTA